MATGVSTACACENTVRRYCMCFCRYACILFFSRVASFSRNANWLAKPEQLSPHEASHVMYPTSHLSVVMRFSLELWKYRVNVVWMISLFLRGISSVKGELRQKWKFYHELLTLKSFNKPRTSVHLRKANKDFQEIRKLSDFPIDSSMTDFQTQNVSCVVVYWMYKNYHFIVFSSDV